MYILSLKLVSPVFKTSYNSYIKTIPRLKHTDLTNSLKHEIEKRWNIHASQGSFNLKDVDNKYYVLSMFPYPSGNLHMGHVRVYSISDAMARFYRMNGKNVFHPIGWDAFGLPAENAAIQRNVQPADWTQSNISQMKAQLKSLGCSFDWSHELSTCNESYFKWTQKLFLMLFKQGLAYQKEALVNWDPVDKTVLADEQVDSNGRSWRSGAKVEKKLLKQWFIKTTKFAKDLYEGLNDPVLQDWKDIINLQKHWIGECNGYSFDMKVASNEQELQKTSQKIRLWTRNPEYLMDRASFIVVKNSNYLRKHKSDYIKIFNPFTKKCMPLVFCDEVSYADGCDTYIASPNENENDRLLAESLKINITQSAAVGNIATRNRVLEEAHKLNIGGYQVSSKLQDWLISRQRRWGTPIPIVHCKSCGPVPVEDSQLPVNLLDDKNSISAVCPKCHSTDARKETDTMDTFVDSSWYFLRYLDSKNEKEIFDSKISMKFMPVDLYIGGKEHAVLHLYYARFMNHFLHSLGLVPKREPFQRLLVQGMVMGRSFRVKETGSYIEENEVTIINAKKNKAIEKSTGKQVVMTWEKMSKSKLNGVDPSDMIGEYGCDTTRLILLADVAPTSHRNWSTATFPGVLNWQNRLWRTINEFNEIRSSSLPSVEVNSDDEGKMFDARNYYTRGATFNYRHSHQLSVAISKMQGLTNSLRRASKDVVSYSKQYERALAAQIIMLAPLAPHFACELWSIFISAPGRLNIDSDEIKWDKSALEQTWPDVDMEYKLDLTLKVNGIDIDVIKMPRHKLDKLNYDDTMDIAFKNKALIDFIGDRKAKRSHFVLYPGCDAIFYLFMEKDEKKTEEVLSKEN